MIALPSCSHIGLYMLDHVRQLEDVIDSLRKNASISDLDHFHALESFVCELRVLAELLESGKIEELACSAHEKKPPMDW